MELYYVLSIVDRSNASSMLKIHEELNVGAVLANLGKGTATSEHLLLYDLSQTDKAIITGFATRPTMKELIKQAKRKLYIDIPGNGIMMAIPVKAVSGGKNLSDLINGQEIGGSSPDMNFDNELIVVILNEGYSDTVMDSARAAGATGGTVIHAKGTGRAGTEKFHGVSLADEKDMIYILAPSGKKSEIMQTINRDCGTHTKVGAVSFSLPVSEVAGIRRLDD